MLNGVLRLYCRFAIQVPKKEDRVSLQRSKVKTRDELVMRQKWFGGPKSK